MSDSPLTVRFEDIGISSTRIKSWEVNSAYLVSTDGFQFELYERDWGQLRDLELEPVELLVDGQSQLFGRIDKTSIGNDGSAVTCYGRDYLADIVECNIDPTFQLKEGMQLAEAVLLACAPCGVFEVMGEEDLRTADIRTGRLIKRGGKKHKVRTDKLSDYKPKVGEGIFEFCNRLVARHGATVQPTDTRGIIGIESPNYEQEVLYSIHVTAQQQAGARNNVIRATAERDFSKFPTWTQGSNKAARVGEKASGTSRTFDMFDVAGKTGGELGRILQKHIVQGRVLPKDANQSTVKKLYRLLYIEDIEAKDQDQLDNAVYRAVAERLKDTLEYRCTLRGHTDPVSGAIWSVNTLVHVIDEIRGLDEVMWIAERTLKFSEGDGATTDIVCWRPGAFQIWPK